MSLEPRTVQLQGWALYHYATQTPDIATVHKKYISFQKIETEKKIEKSRFKNVN